MFGIVPRFGSQEIAKIHFGGNIGAPLFTMVTFDQLPIARVEGEKPLKPPTVSPGLTEDEIQYLEGQRGRRLNLVGGHTLIEVIVATAIRLSESEPLVIGPDYYAYKPLSYTDRMRILGVVESQVDGIRQHNTIGLCLPTEAMPILVGRYDLS